jgi:hypothetical protein
VANYIAQHVLNHVKVSVDGVYDVYEYLDEKRAALEKWAGYLAELKDREMRPELVRTI